jgi:Flp pilus assembly protein TadG
MKRAKANGVPKSAKICRGFMRLLRDRSGAAAILVALCMPVLVGFAGLAVEIGLNYSQKRLLQSAADAAAIGAAEVAYMSGTADQINAAGVADLATNLGGTGDSSTMKVTVGTNVASVEVHNPPIHGAYTSDSTGVEVILTQPQNVLISRLITGNSTQNIQVRAVAISSDAPGKACLLSLKPGTVGIKDSGSPKLTLKGCGMASNSSDNSSSMTANGTAKVKADWVHLSGDCSTCVVGTNVMVPSTEYVTNGARIGDPYMGYTAPTTNGGTQTDPKVKNNDNVTLSPGTYSSGLTISGGTANFSPGVYVITGNNSLKITGGTVTGSGVTFVIANGASVDLEGNGSTTLSAPTSGSYSGMLFYGYTATTQNNGIKFTGTATQNLNGALYFPKSDISYSGTNASSGVCTNVVGLTVGVVGNNTGTIDCSGSGGGPVPPTYPYLVE